MTKYNCLLVLASALFFTISAQATSPSRGVHLSKEKLVSDIWSTLSSYEMGVRKTLKGEWANISSYREGKAYFQVGPFWGLAGKDQHININGAIGDTYDTTDNSDVNVLLGLGYYTKSIDKGAYDLSYGFNMFYLGKTTYKGTITQ